MKLDDHLKKTGQNNADFGRAVSASEATISRLRNGKQSPSNELMRRIMAVTAGDVMPNDFFSVPVPVLENEGQAA